MGLISRVSSRTYRFLHKIFNFLLKNLQNDEQKHSKAINTLTAQLTENTMVQQELDLISEDSIVYKQVGPALIKQEKTEVKLNVDKRIDYIKSQIKSHDASLKEIDSK